VSHYSVVGSIHPTSIPKGSGAQVGGDRGVPEAMLDWLNQLVKGPSNPLQALEQFQKLNPPVFKGDAD